MMRFSVRATTAILLVVVAVLGGFFAGTRAGQIPQAAYVIAGTPVPTPLQQPLNDLWQGYQHLNRDSYWRPFPNPQNLLYHAVEGMMAAASPQDPHTTFIEPQINSVVSTALQQQIYGIGATVAPVKAGLLIDPLVGSPATLAGLLPGDTITHVNGRSIAGMAGDAAATLIRGPQGTKVALTIVRAGVKHPFVVHVTRGTIPNVADGIVGTIGVIAFQAFDVDTAGEVQLALRQLEAQHITGLILDLRDNGGGYVSSAQAIASEFLPKGATIYWLRSNNGHSKTTDMAVRVTTPGIAQHVRVAILVNANTASAAEILTAALRENGRATVIGTPTYGKGSVQEDLSLPDGSALRITIQLWLTPDKHWVQGHGITPDILVQAGTTSSGQDAQMARALQYLHTGH